VNPVVVHVFRPYPSEQAYLLAEAWTIDSRSMLLIDSEPLAADTAVLFDVTLADGSKPIRAEGRVVGAVAPNAGRPGGLRIRFKRFGAATKAFIERAVKSRSDPGEVERRSQPDAERPSRPEGERVSLPEVRASMTDLEAPAPPPPSEPSHTRQRAPGPVAAPPNRDELLERLRQRRKAG
jgi:hypothetical protein